MSTLVVIDHPLVAHKLSLMRDKTHADGAVPALCCARSRCCWATRCCATCQPSCATSRRPSARRGRRSSRARSWCSCRSCAPATGSSTACSTSFPRRAWATSASTAIPATLAAVEYYCKLPDDIGERLTVVVDPMLATGNSAVAAISRLKDARRARHPPGLPAGRAGGDRGAGPRPSGGPRLHRRRRRAPERPRLHRARAGRRRRPHVRDEVAGTEVRPQSTRGSHSTTSG